MNSTLFELFQSDLIVSRILYSAVVIIVGVIISGSMHHLLGFLFTGVKGRIESKKFIAKTVTLRSLVNNVMDVFILLMVFFVILSHWGVNILPLLTGAGIVGLAISFGSQTIVKDMLSGFFIIVEDQYNIGDHVQLADKYEGTVESITLRLTILKGKNNNIIYIPNSQITSVIRFTGEKKS